MTDEPMDTEEPGRLRQMYEEAARDRAAAQAELARLQSRELFREAGFDLSSAQHKAFLKGYDGELTPEAVNAYADELGINTVAPVDDKPIAPPRDETQAIQRIAQAAMEASILPTEPDAAARITQEMANAARGNHATKQELDRLSEQLTRARGFRTLSDMQNH